MQGTPGNQIINLNYVMQPFPCSPTAQANPLQGVGLNMECFGNAGPGSLLTIPHTHVNNWDITFQKSFPLKSERRSLTFQLQAYNIFNHTQFSGASLGQTFRLEQLQERRPGGEERRHEPFHRRAEPAADVHEPAVPVLGNRFPPIRGRATPGPETSQFWRPDAAIASGSFSLCDAIADSRRCTFSPCLSCFVTPGRPRPSR